MVVAETVDVGVGQGLEQLDGARTLGRDQARRVAAVLERGVEPAGGEEPAQVRDVRLAVGRVADEQVPLVDAVDDQVVDHPAIAPAQH